MNKLMRRCLICHENIISQKSKASFTLSKHNSYFDFREKQRHVIDMIQPSTSV